MRQSPQTQNSTPFTRRQVLKSGVTGVTATTLGLVQAEVSRGADANPPEYDDTTVVRESVWVETDTDTDNTGELDRTHVSIARPQSAEPLPVLVRADPYAVPDNDRADLSPDYPNYQSKVNSTMEVELYRPDASVSTQGNTNTIGVVPGQVFDRSYYYEKALLPEGYIFAYASPLGTGLSTGCSSLGGKPEIASIKAVIDWLNGRRKAYDSRSGGKPVDAAWTTGTTGMFGGSYRGTLANGVAATGVDGLETIVPIRSISSWYSYVRSNGAVISGGQTTASSANPLTMLAAFVTTRTDSESCDTSIDEMTKKLDRKTGNYNDFWAERDYTTGDNQINASVLAVHGISDTNTRPRQLTKWLDVLRDEDVPYKVWVHQGGHDDPREHENKEKPWVELLKKWFGYWLKDKDNGVMERPTALVERPDKTLTEAADWPSERSETVPLRLHPNGENDGQLMTTVPSEPGTETLVDDSTQPPTQLLEAESQENRLVYRTETLDGPVRVSGQIEPQLTLSVDSPAALLSVGLVDFGPDEAEIVTRGWMNLQNRETLEHSRRIDPGTEYTVTFPTEPAEHVFEQGHRLGVMVFSSDYTVTKRPPSSPELTITLSESLIDVPIVGGTAAFKAALSGETVPEPYGVTYTYPGEQESDGDAGSEESTNETPAETETTPTETPTEATKTESLDEATPTTDTATDSERTAESQKVDDNGAGFGVVSAVSGVGALGYVLKRRFRERQ
ncbi:CocE/NonD family hydrolase [Halovenus rubra]|uniref:Xaa-Pro dipeptidyl-peptidase n=2 Tax=Halovenus rubra TaxID=869890 RepID=A0ABD5XCR7_9EURY|nr:CocE/NonD family hydrolase [Halovenus rubra]